MFFCAFALAVTVLFWAMAPLTDALDRGPWGRALAPTLLVALVGVVYETVFVAARGQTPAKDLFDVKVVVRGTPDAPDRLRAGGRSVLVWSWLLVPDLRVALLLVAAGALATALQPGGRGPHDRLLGTDVVGYDADVEEGPIARPDDGAVERRYGPRSWWRALTNPVSR